jgi:hypothetical protein
LRWRTTATSGGAPRRSTIPPAAITGARAITRFRVDPIGPPTI